MSEESASLYTALDILDIIDAEIERAQTEMSADCGKALTAALLDSIAGMTQVRTAIAKKYFPEETNPAPAYEHDCKVCHFLGHYHGADLYYCNKGAFPTVIARTGGAEKYKSMPVKMVPDVYKPGQHLRVAYALALDSGLHRP